MKCPACHQEIKDSAKFCAKCGKEIPRCPQCGKVIYKRARFCTYDGAPLPENLLALLPEDSRDTEVHVTESASWEKTAVQPGAAVQQEKKNHGIFIILAAVAALVLVLALGLISFMVKSGSVAAVLSKIGWEGFGGMQEEENLTGLREEDEKEDARMDEKLGEPANSTEYEDLYETAGESDDTEEDEQEETADYSDIDINAIDNLNVEVSGTVKNKNQQCILKLKKAVSVCAYGPTGNAVTADKVKKMIFSEESGMEEYDGAEVTVTAGLSAGSGGQFILEVTGLNIDKEAPDGQSAYLSHRYEFLMGDVTWQEAFDECIRRGGYLVRINSEQEFQYLIEQIEEAGMQKIHFYLGGRRADNDEDYYWTDEKGRFTGDILNPGEGQWTTDHWMVNEPSFSAGADEEMYMNLIYYQDNWVLNDVPLDITKYYPGKTAYICEYDE